MITAHQRSLPRTLLLAGLAFAGTLASFGATTSPAFAQPQGKGYTATLATPVEAPKREVINGVLWRCEGDSCSAPLDGSSPANACAKAVRKLGTFKSFATPKGEMPADKLERCNSAA